MIRQDFFLSGAEQYDSLWRSKKPQTGINGSSDVDRRFSPFHTNKFEKAIVSLCGDRMVPLSNVLAEPGRISFAYVSIKLKSMIGRPLEADDFCRTCEKKYNLFSSGALGKQNIHYIMNFLKEQKSYFSPEALLIETTNNQTTLEKIVSKNLVDEFLDPDYWRHAPDVLFNVCDAAPPSMRAKIDRLLATIDAKPPSGSLLPKPAYSAKQAQDIAASIAKLQEMGNKIAVPTVDQLVATLNEANGNLEQIWTFGDETLDLRLNFVFAAMELTTATPMHCGVSGLIADFLDQFSKAKHMLDAYVEQSQGKKGKSQGWSFFGRKNVRELVELSDAIAMARRAGQSLTSSVPGIDAAGKTAVQKMNMSNYVVNAYDQLDQSLEVHQKAAKIFLQGGVSVDEKEGEHPRQRPDEAVVRVLEDKMQMIADVRGAIAADRGAEKLVGGVLARQAYVYRQQTVLTMPALALQVKKLHETLDFVHASVSSRGMADASRLAASEQTQNLILAACKTIEAITATVEGAREGAKDIEQQVVAVLGERTALPHEPVRHLAAAGTSPAQSVRPSRTASSSSSVSGPRAGNHMFE